MCKTEIPIAIKIRKYVRIYLIKEKHKTYMKKAIQQMERLLEQKNIIT